MTEPLSQHECLRTNIEIMMKRHFSLLLFSAMSLAGHSHVGGRPAAFTGFTSGMPADSAAESKSLLELFKSMPDSIMPYLTENNRLDMIDFLEAGMKAEVTNKLECKSEMTYLSSDSISLRMSEGMKIDLFIVPTKEVYDSCQQVICMRRTFFVNSREAETVDTFYSMAWRLLSSLPPVTHHTPVEMVFGLDKVIDLRGRENF